MDVERIAGVPDCVVQSANKTSGATQYQLNVVKGNDKTTSRKDIDFMHSLMSMSELLRHVNLGE